MKALRVYLLMAVVWVSVGLSLVACSDKEKNGAPQACVSPMISVNGYCTYDPSNPGSGFPPGGYGFSPNGDITDNSKFRDFNYRLFNNYYYCIYQSPYDCEDIQVKVQKINNTEYRVFITTPSLSGSQVILQGTKFVRDGSDEVIFEVYYNNPTRYIIAELNMHHGMSGSSSYYTLNFKDNASWKTIASGTMDKGMDY